MRLTERCGSSISVGAVIIFSSRTLMGHLSQWGPLKYFLTVIWWVIISMCAVRIFCNGMLMDHLDERRYNIYNGTLMGHLSGGGR